MNHIWRYNDLFNSYDLGNINDLTVVIRVVSGFNDAMNRYRYASRSKDLSFNGVHPICAVTY
jgi:hypothetical protein